MGIRRRVFGRGLGRGRLIRVTFVGVQRTLALFFFSPLYRRAFHLFFSFDSLVSTRYFGVFLETFLVCHLTFLFHADQVFCILSNLGDAASG